MIASTQVCVWTYKTIIMCRFINNCLVNVRNNQSQKLTLVGRTLVILRIQWFDFINWSPRMLCMHGVCIVTACVASLRFCGSHKQSLLCIGNI
jgi:hypothetical protein